MFATKAAIIGFRQRSITGLWTNSMTLSLLNPISNLDFNMSQRRLLHQEKPPRSKDNVIFSCLVVGGVVVLGYTLYYQKNKLQNVKENTLKYLSITETKTKLESTEDTKLWHTTFRQDLPEYKLEDIRKHNTIKDGVWVTYGIGVYDITEFIPKHPGRDKIMLAAGSAVDPFWAIYQQHNNKDILTMLEQYRIGNISADDEIDTENIDSIWEDEPKRHVLLKPTSQRPFNAEPPLSTLCEEFITPNEFFYVRNHLPVPTINVEEFVLGIEVETLQAKAKTFKKSLQLKDIKALPKHTVTAAVMCGGNRRSEMSAVKPLKGLSWSGGAVGNAKWSGARLRDVLITLGIEPNENLHVILEGADLDPTGNPFGASIPLSKALDERGDVILAYEMNGKPLNRDHGFPLRCIVPGTVGVRNVKWLTRITISEKESNSHWQQNDYKGFSPSTDWDTVDFSKSPPIQAMPVTSAICSPTDGDEVKVSDDGYLTVRGYAWSGGGRRIIRVDLTADQGKTWHIAELEQEDQPDGRHYGWSLWSARIPINNTKKHVEIWAKAVDSAYNVQPESFQNIWNLRGLLSNAYHRIQVKIV